MEQLILCFEIIGVISFALAGAMTGLRKGMDIFGVCVLGLTTAVGGGIVRDLILGKTPPAAFRDPVSVLTAIGVSIVVFIPAVRRIFYRNRRLYELVLLWADSVGLGIFAVCGVRVAMETGYADNPFLAVFVGALTGVGGGVLRDMFAGDRPYIFVKHVYACAALLGAVACTFLWPVLGRNGAMLMGFGVVLVMRLCSAHFRWSLPHSPQLEEEKNAS